MQLSINAILSPDEASDLRRRLASALFEDGSATAGWAAASVKRNEQAVASVEIEDLLHATGGRLTANAVFQLAARPKRIVKAMFSRYVADHVHAYGTHVDNALIDGERTDVSFTLFLSEPQSYDGGELVIESSGGEEAIKLPAGCVFVYPSTTLHRVEPVVRGERLAMVGWVRSLVREAARRELLFDLDTARRTLFERGGKTVEFDLLSKSCANLLRMWCDD